MANKITYGSDEYRVNDDEKLRIFLKAVEDAVNGDGPRWVDIPDSKNTRIFVTAGIPISVVEIKTGSRGRVVVVR